MLTEARVWVQRPCRTSASKSSGGAWAEVGDGIDVGLLRAPELHGSACGVPGKPMEGLAWPERHRRWAISTAASSRETASGLNSGMRKGEGQGERAWGRSWARDRASAVALVGCSAAGQPAHGEQGHGVVEVSWQGR
jgi:hypothetical protein